MTGVAEREMGLGREAVIAAMLILAPGCAGKPEMTPSRAGAAAQPSIGEPWNGDVQDEADTIDADAVVEAPGPAGCGQDILACALEVAGLLQDEDERDEYRTGVALAYAHAGMCAEALDVADRLEEEGARALAAERLLGHVVPPCETAILGEIASRIPDANKRRDGLGRQAALLAKWREYGKAREVLELSDDIHSARQQLASVASIAAEKGDCAASLDIAGTLGTDVQGDGKKALIGALVLCKSTGEAEKLARSSAPDPEQTAEGLVALAAAMSDQGAGAEAAGILAEAAGLVKSTPAAEALAFDMGSAWASAGKPDKARASCKSLPVDEDEHECLAQVVQDLAEAGDYKAARAVASKIGDQGMRDTAFVDIAWLAAMAGEAIAVVGMASKVEDMTSRAEFLLWIAEEHVKAGRYDEAMLLGKKVKGEEARKFYFREVAELLAGIRRYDLAKKALAKSHVPKKNPCISGTATKIHCKWNPEEPDNADWIVLGIELGHLVEDNKVAEAMARFELVKDSDDGLHAQAMIWEISEALVRAGKPGEALDLVLEHESSLDLPGTLGWIAHIATSRGMPCWGLVAALSAPADSLASTLVRFSNALGGFPSPGGPAVQIVCPDVIERVTKLLPPP